MAASHTVWTHMQATGVQTDNVTRLSLARIEAIKGNAAGALEWVSSDGMGQNALEEGL